MALLQVSDQPLIISATSNGILNVTKTSDAKTCPSKQIQAEKGKNSSIVTLLTKDN